VGDTVEVLSTKPPRPYGAGKVVESVQAPQDSEHSVTIEYEGKVFTGNNQQILLEQLEQQGIRVPYSCRAGICGSCRITLLSGEVAPLKKSALGDNGTILCCSCIPKSDLTLA
ncbi:2Fe-2S iron-sulfur cluster binding domain-containing protein, partial [Serratia marcescens]|nr:2Fe-2S iron-sulfur cluster binding domain-containing protein [Serratia marcescens]